MDSTGGPDGRLVAKPQDNDTTEKTVQVGAFVPVSLADEFRLQCEQRDFKKRVVLARLLRWWVALPAEIQAQFYHGMEPEPAQARLVKLDDLRALVDEVLDDRLQGRKGKRPPRSS